MAISLPTSLQQVDAAGPLASNETGAITAAVLRGVLQRIIEEIQANAGAEDQATQAVVYDFLKLILQEGTNISFTEADDSLTLNIAASVVFPAWSNQDTYDQGQPVFHSGGVYVARQDIEMASNTGPDVDRANWITTTTYRGDYNATHYYDEGQIVKDDDNNFYVARSSRSPSATKPQDDSTNWANLTSASGGAGALTAAGLNDLLSESPGINIAIDSNDATKVSISLDLTAAQVVAAIDARVAAGVLDWAEAGNTDPIPAAKLSNAPSGEGGNLPVLANLPDVTSYDVGDALIVGQGVHKGLYVVRPAASDRSFVGTIGTSEVSAVALQIHLENNPDGALNFFQWETNGSSLFFLVNKSVVSTDPGTLYIEIQSVDGTSLSQANRVASRVAASRDSNYDTSAVWAYYPQVPQAARARWAALRDAQRLVINIYSDSGYSTNWISTLNKHWVAISGDTDQVAGIQAELERIEQELAPEWADPPSRDQISAGWAFAINSVTSGRPGTASPPDSAYQTETYTVPGTDAVETRFFLRTPNDADSDNGRIELIDTTTAYYPLGNYGWTKIAAPSDGDESTYDYYILQSNNNDTQFGLLPGNTATLQTMQDFVQLYSRVNMLEIGLGRLNTSVGANTTATQNNATAIGLRLTQAEVDARVIAGTISTARAGNTARWPKNKLPDDIVYDADAVNGFLEEVVTLNGVVTQPTVEQNGVLFNSNATTRRTVTFQTDNINYPEGYRVGIRASNTGIVVVNQTVNSVTEHRFTVTEGQLLILIKEPGENNFIELDNSEEIDQRARDAITSLQHLTNDLEVGRGVPGNWRQADEIKIKITSRDTAWTLADARSHTTYENEVASTGTQADQYILVRLDHAADPADFRVKIDPVYDSDADEATHYLPVSQMDPVGNSLPVNGTIQYKFFTQFYTATVTNGHSAELEESFGRDETGRSTYSGILDGAFRIEEYPSLAGSFIRISQTDYEALPDAVKENGKIYSIYDPDAPTEAPGPPAFVRQESAGADEITYYFGPSNTGGRVQYYEWRHALRSANFAGSWNRIAAHAGEFTARSLNAGTEYKAQIRAGNTVGNSAAVAGNGQTLAS